MKCLTLRSLLFPGAILILDSNQCDRFAIDASRG
jgi:hypothetical protein